MLAGEQRHFVEAGQIGRQSRGTANLFNRLFGTRERLIHHFLSALAGKQGAWHEVDRQLQHMLCTLGKDHTIDTGSRTAVACGNRINLLPTRVKLVDPLACFLPQPAIVRGKDSRLDMLLVVLFDGVADRLHAAVEPLGNPSMHIGRAGTSSRQSPSPRDDFFLLIGGKLAKAATTLDSQRIGFHEAIDHAGRKSNSLAATDLVVLGLESVATPARDRLGRNAETLRDFLDR